MKIKAEPYQWARDTAMEDGSGQKKKVSRSVRSTRRIMETEIDVISLGFEKGNFTRKSEFSLSLIPNWMVCPHSSSCSTASPSWRPAAVSRWGSKLEVVSLLHGSILWPRNMAEITRNEEGQRAMVVPAYTGDCDFHVTM
jgi:hypothetical protein